VPYRASASRRLDAADALDQVVVAERVRQAQVPAGAERLAGHDGDLGLLVLDGLLMRDVTFARAACTELLGRGDLLRPWDWEREVVTVRPQVVWTALQPVRLAVLDRRITAIIGRWPELVSAVAARAVRRASELATTQATSHLTRVDARLELLFWGLADRWGRVSTDGVVLELPLTHQVLGRLIGAQRPSVTTALSDLTRRGVIARRDDGALVLGALLVAGLIPLAEELLFRRKRCSAWMRAGRPTMRACRPMDSIFGRSSPSGSPSA